MAVAKALIIIMTTLIVVLTGLIVYGLYQKSQGVSLKIFGSEDAPIVQTEIMPTAPPSTGAMQQGVSFGEVSLDLPATARVISAHASAGRLVMLIARDGQNADLVAVVDLGTGKVLGRVKTTP